MKWTGGSKEALKNRKRVQGSHRFASPRKRIDDVFFASGDGDMNEAVRRPITSRRVQTSLASISQWSQAAGLIVPSVTDSVCKAGDDENNSLADSHANCSALKRISNVSLPKTTLSELISPERLLQSSQFPPKQPAVHDVGRVFINRNFETDSSSAHANSHQSARPELMIGRITEPVSMQPSCIVQSPTSLELSKVTKDQARPLSEKSGSSGQIASKRRILDDDVRVEFSPGKDLFFAYSCPLKSKVRKASLSA